MEGEIFFVFPVFVYIFMTYVAHRSFTFHGNKVHFLAFLLKIFTFEASCYGSRSFTYFAALLRRSSSIAA